MMDTIFIVLILVTLLPHATPITFELKRAMSVGMHQANHGLGVVNFTVQGSIDIFRYYYTTVKIGSPPRDFNLLIDTGSDITWISCEPCDGCPTLNRYGVPRNSYSPNRSSSASSVSCSNKICLDTGSGCSQSLCSYSIDYEDKSISDGYLVEDTFHLDTIVNGRGTTNSSTSVHFGCSKFRSGNLASDTMVDGILGLGHGLHSIVSQLSSRGVVPKVLSHCLRRDEGGILVLGKILHHGITYTPLVPSGKNYNLNLKSIAIGENVNIDPSGKTLIDSGTTFLTLAEKTYDRFTDSLRALVSRSAPPVFMESILCFQMSSWDRVNSIFAEVSFNFEGGASIVVRPEDYLKWYPYERVACIIFDKGDESTILGNLVLRDKIVIYDLANQQVGWDDFDCSQSINVSSTVNYMHPPHRSASNLTVKTLLHSVISCIATVLMYFSLS